MCFITNAMLINLIERKCHVKNLKNSGTYYLNDFKGFILCE